ncbi:MAG: hypothetical protein M0Q26_13925 [Chitinophagaceae bacterium]|nr:hypothetical protein [Chitinophagaceae bacterium]MDP1763447.1 hypothetical protein [Sediminibacterium sp.]
MTNPPSITEHIYSLVQDAVIWKARKLYNPAGSPDDKQKGIEGIVNMLSCISSEVKRDNYVEVIVEQLKIKKGHVINALKNKLTLHDDMQQKEETVYKLPEWANKDRVYNFALDWRENEGEHTGIYFSQTGNQLVQMTNFVIKPLFHLFDMAGNTRRLALLHSNHTKDSLIELPSKAFTSLDKFEETMLDRGNYHTIEGFGKPHLKRLFRAIGNKFPFAHELKYLGWQGEGFWSYSDAIFDGQKVTKFSDLGIAQIKEKFYYSPAASSLYFSDRMDEDGREVMDDDPYENDKYLRYQKGTVDFEEWSKQMMLMHGDAGYPLITYAIVSVFKDVITAYEKCPILYGYGLVQSGKSTWAEGLYYLFYDKHSKPFNLNQGTVYAFFNRMERFRNCPQLFNEFDEDYIDEDFFRAFKSFYDGEGRDRGKGIKGKTETQKINCTVILVGQTLTTKDGASVLIRSIPVKFHDPGERTNIEKENYDKWTAWTNKGLNSCLIDIIRHRKYFKQHFMQVFNEELIKLKTSIREEGDVFKERIAKNYCILLACGKVMLEQLQLGFTYEDMFAYCKKNIVGLSRMISEVDNLATFWKTVEFLYERGDIIEGQDYKLEEESQVRKSLAKETITVPFDKPTKVLYLRLTKVYPLYAQNFRQTTGNKPINQRTLETYFESSKQYIGNNPSGWFDAPGGKRSNTSSYMFYYPKIGINLERSEAPVADNRKQFEIDAVVSKPAELRQVGDHFVVSFTVYYYDTTTAADQRPKTERVYIKCFSTNQDYQPLLGTDTTVKISGLLSEKKSKGFTYRNMDVESIEFTKSGFKQADLPEEMNSNAPF